MSADGIERLVLSEVPLRRDVPPDWADVVERAGLAHRTRRRLVIALAAAALVVSAAAAVAAGLGGFDSWLRGSPGKPASPEKQRAFETENRSWTAFPRGTKLRELVRTTAGGREYVLYGFTSGDTACLRLDAVTLRQTQQSCIPLSTLAHADTPLVVGAAREGLGTVGPFDSALVSYGIVADGVRRVDAEAIDGVHHATVGGNAYLVVDSEPSTGNDFLRFTATGADGKRITFAVPRTDFWNPGRPARGPTRIEAEIRHPRVGWYERGEKRGVSLDEITLTPAQRKAFARAETMGGLRLIKPDPASGLVVGLAGNLCIVNAGGSYGCSTPEHFFDLGPVAYLGSGANGGPVVQGVAADGVARVRLFLADGVTLTPPLKDNVFAARVAVEQFPVRIVSYDGRGRIVGVLTFPPTRRREEAPAAARRLHASGTVQGPNGARATLRRGPAARGYRCWRVTFSPGPSRGSCRRVDFTQIVELVQQAGDDLFLVGTTFPATTRVEVHFRDGKTVFTRPTAGHLVFPLPRDRLSTTRHAATVIGRNKDGRVLQRQEVAFRLGSSG